MPYLPGVHLLPATGEFTYDTTSYLGQRSTEPSLSAINTYYVPSGSKTDYSYALDQLQSQHPECTTVSVVCAWFCDGIMAGSCNVFPSTTYIGGSFQQSVGPADVWRCSGLTQASSGLIPIPTNGSGNFIYGGTPSDQSIVRCVRDLKSRGLNVVFYPFLLLTCSGLPWRGRISYSPDVSTAATNAVAAFLGSASPSQFTPDYTNLTVGYTGYASDWTFRRMILHYANLMLVAGGANLFVIGSELRGLETIRGSSWTKAGVSDGAGHAIWDYPFVSGLAALATDVRSVFDAAGLHRNAGTFQNLIAYSADWSDWMGYQHPGANGQWPHLDQLWASSALDFVAFDNYLPLSDWTTSESSLDEVNWNGATPSSWPVAAPDSIGLGLTGPPTLCSKAYLKANIEGGEKFNWYYENSSNGGAGYDPNGSGLLVSLPEGDRLTQSRQPYFANQQILANKQLRWWWNSTHKAVYDTGSGWQPQGLPTQWTPQSKSIVFLEYGVPTVDKGSNQPNLFYSPNSTESGTPYWSIWNPAPGGVILPQRDDTIAGLALDSIYEYWNTDGNNAISFAGAPMVQFGLSCVWNWDARPFPTFPLLSSVWGDASAWPYGNWLSGKGPTLAPQSAAPSPSPGAFASFPTLSTSAWSVRITPRWRTDIFESASGRELRRQNRAYAQHDIELTYDCLPTQGVAADFELIVGFFLNQGGAATPFWFAPPGLTTVVNQALGLGDGVTTVFSLTRTWQTYIEPVRGTAGVTAVYLNSTPQAIGWSVSSGYSPTVYFTTAPAPGSVVSADFTDLWLCRFALDSTDFEEFMQMLWTLQSLRLQVVEL